MPMKNLGTMEDILERQDWQFQPGADVRPAVDAGQMAPADFQCSCCSRTNSFQRPRRRCAATDRSMLQSGRAGGGKQRVHQWQAPPLIDHGCGSKKASREGRCGERSMNHNVAATGWTDAMARERIADLHREAEQERLARQARRGHDQTVALGRAQTPDRSIRGFPGWLRRLLRSRGYPGSLAEGRERYAVNDLGAEGLLPCQPDHLVDERIGTRTPGAVPEVGPHHAADRYRAIEVRGREA
jgi:hypothetical protein